MEDQEYSIDLAKLRGLDEDLQVDSSEAGGGCLLITEAGGHVRVSSSARQLLRWVHQGRTFDELAEELSKRGQTITPESLEKVHRQVIHSLGAADETAARALAKSFWLRLRLIPQRWVVPVASRLAVMFHPVVVTAGLGLVVLLGLGLLALGPQLTITARDFWLGYALFVASLVVHEFGHAAACARYGAQPSEIGLTLYLIYPAFYSNVTNAWQLTRRQRVIVDLGGNYLQFLVLGLYIVLYIFGGQEMFRVAVTLILYGAVFSLNPIFKFDGYWVVADALGVTNLSDQPKRILRHVSNRLLGRPAEPLPWPKSVVWTLALYTPLSLLVWSYFILRLVPFLWRTTLGYPARVMEVVARLADGGGWRLVMDLLVPTLILLVLYSLLFRMARMVLSPLYDKAVTAWRRHRGPAEASAT